MSAEQTTENPAILQGQFLFWVYLLCAICVLGLALFVCFKFLVSRSVTDRRPSIPPVLSPSADFDINVNNANSEANFNTSYRVNAHSSMTSTPQTPSTPASPSNLTTLHLPQFWKFNPKGYFHSVDLLFLSNNITSETLKYSLLLQALSKSTQVLQRLSDVLASIDHTIQHPQISVNPTLLIPVVGVFTGHSS